MKYIVIDLEMNPVSKTFGSEKNLCKTEVIQIGAVALNDQYQEIGSFKTLVKPQLNNVIVRRIERLTKITTQMVQNAPVFEEALRMFFEWCFSLEDQIQIHQWSESDYFQMQSEINRKEIELSDNEMALMRGWKDFQKEFGIKLGLTDALSLKNAIMYAGVDLVGCYHDALYDARNTAALFRIVRDPDECKKALSLVISALNPTPAHTTLGDLFNFNELALIS